MGEFLKDLDISEAIKQIQVNEQEEKLSQIFTSIFMTSDKPVTLGELVDKLEHHGIAISLMLLALPAALPIPAAGYSTILSIPLFGIGIAILMGADKIVLPKRIRNFEFSPAKIRKVIGVLIKLMIFIERFSQPRFSVLLKTRIAHMLIGTFICLLACFMFLPIPLTNTLPAAGIFLIGFGLLELDLLLVAIGMLFSLFAMAVPIVIAFLGYEVFSELINNLKNKFF